MLSKVASSTIFWVFGMTRPGIKPRSPGPLANTLIWEFFTLALANFFQLEFEWQQVSRTLVRILADLNNPVVWMVSTRPLNSKSPSPYTNRLMTVPSATITIGIIVTFMFHSFFSSPARSVYSALFSLSFGFTRCTSGTTKFAIRLVLYLFVDYH